MVEQVVLVFLQGYRASAGCHHGSHKAEPRSVAGLGVAVLLLLLASAANLSFRWSAHSSRFLRSITGATLALAVLIRAFSRASSFFKDSIPSLRSFRLL